MDFNDNPKEAEFRTKVRKFLDENAQRRGEVIKTPTTAGAPESVSGEKAANDAFVVAANLSLTERKTILQEILDGMMERRSDLAQAISEEMGAPLWLSNVAQVTSGLSHFKDTLEVLKTFEFEGIENNYLIRKEPIGVIGMITPWNWPMNQMCTKVASAIASGCTMVLKPSEITPFCGIIFAECVLTNFKADKSLRIEEGRFGFDTLAMSKKFISKFSTHLLLYGVKTEKGLS